MNKGMAGSNQMIDAQMIANRSMEMFIELMDDQKAWTEKFGSPHVFGAWVEEGITKYAHGGFKYPKYKIVGTGTTLTEAMGDYIRQMMTVVDDSYRKADAATYDLDKVKEALGIQT